jgi:hypothetical protein
MIKEVLTSEKLFIIRDLNGHIGTTRREFEMVHEGFGYCEQYQEGEEILNFTIVYDLMVANYMDCKVIPDECVVTQHTFLVADFYFQARVQ